MTLSETGSDSSGPDQRPDCVGGGVKAEAGVFIDYWCFYYRSKDMKPFWCNVSVDAVTETWQTNS